MKRIKLTFMIGISSLFMVSQSNAQWSQTGTNVYTTTSTDDVGIGTSTPTSALHVTDITVDITPNVAGAQLSSGVLELAKNTFPYIDFNHSPYGDDYDARLILRGDDKLSVDGADFTVASSFRLGVGTHSPTEAFQVNTNTASGFAGYFFNDGNNLDRYGIKIQCGLDDQTAATDNYYLRGFDGDGTEEGGLKVTTGTMQIYQGSDRRFKTNIQNTKIKGLDIITKLRVVDYNWLRNPNGPLVTGFIAQELEEVYPVMVGQFPETGNLNISPLMLIPVIVQSTQEQQKILDKQKSTIAEQGEQVETLREELQKLSERFDEYILAQGEANETKTILLADSEQGVVLNQNDPNPFAEHTSISYFIPDNIHDAQIWIYDISGKIMRKINVAEKGEGVINVYASDLSSGVYVYSIVADGNTLESKKMMHAKQ